MEILISPIKGCALQEYDQLLTIYQSVHITYFIHGTKVTKTSLLDHIYTDKIFILEFVDGISTINSDQDMCCTYVFKDLRLFDVSV